MSRLGRNVAANITANVWTTALALLLTPLYVTWLGIESYGLIGFYASWVAIVGILDTGIAATAVRETAWMAVRDEERPRIASLLRTLEVAYWAIIVAVGVILAGVAAWGGAAWFRSTALPGRVIEEALLLMVVALVLQVPSGLYVGGLVGLQRQVASSALVTLFGTVRGVGAVAVLMLVAADIRAFFTWQILISLAQTSVTRWWLFRHADGPVRFSRPLLRRIRGFAAQAGLATTLGLLLTQVDKLILSRLVSLEMFGLYMLAWTVSSGLTRAATPLLQAFGPRFTELASRGDEAGLRRQLQLVSQLMNVLLLPPAAVLALGALPALHAWTGSATIAAGAAPVLSIMVIGTLLTACSYPAANVMYGRDRLRPVIVFGAALALVFVPLLTLAAIRHGTIGAAVCWSLCGLAMYVGYQYLGLRGLPGPGAAAAMVTDFVLPAAATCVVAVVASQLAARAAGLIEVVVLLAAGVIAGWAAALVTCRELFRAARAYLRWSLDATPSSA